MAEEGIAQSRQRFEFSIDVRHKGQINEVEILLPFERLPASYESRLRACSCIGMSSSMGAARRSPARSWNSWSAD